MNVEDLINNVANQDFSTAGPTFAEIMQTKMSDALEQEKISVAGAMFDQTSDQDDIDGDIEDDIDDEDIDDEDIDDEDIDDEDIDDELEQ
jgi:hypothetical protein